MPRAPVRDRIRRLLGDERYRRLTQWPRVLRIAVRPKPPRETAALPQLIRPGDVALDIGANYGQYARVLSPLVGPGGRVHCFEPSEITMEGLRLLCRLLRLRNVSLHRVALSDSPGAADLEIPIKSGGRLGIGLARLHSGEEFPRIVEPVRVDTLDRFADAAGLTRCDFIKCDVEGAEYRVLQGGLATLKRFRPTLIVEIKDAQLRRYGNSAAQLVELLRGYDYDIFLWRDGRLNGVTAINASPNFVFIPRTRRPAQPGLSVP